MTLGSIRLALRAEWTKLRTVADTYWLLLASITLMVGLSALVLAAVNYSYAGATEDTTKLSLTGIQLGQAIVAILAVLVISGEYSTGLIGTTLAAMPRRFAVLAAKAIVVTVSYSPPRPSPCSGQARSIPRRASPVDDRATRSTAAPRSPHLRT